MRLVCLVSSLSVALASTAVAMPLRPGAKTSAGGPIDVKVRRIGEVQATSTPAPPPATALSGRHRLLVILVETRDAPWPKGFEASRYHEILFDRASASVREYFRENSYGLFELDGEVVGPIRVEGRMADYAYERTSPDGARVRTLVERAVRAAGRSTRLSSFDTHDARGRAGRDGMIDHVLLIYAEASGRFDGFSPIWPHRGSTDIDLGSGLRVGSYVVLNHAARLGVYVHELGHDLGLPDLYDRDYSSHGAGDWCTMASGSWAGDSERPVHLSAWAKIRLGWISPRIVSKSEQNLKVPSSSERPFALKVPIGEIDSREYFLIENRRRVGFDAALPGEGLLIWHIDESKGDNDDENRKLADVVEADRIQDLDRLESARPPNYGVDLFSGSGKSAFDDGTEPSARALDGSPSKIRVRVLTPSERVMAVDLDRPEIFNPGGTPYVLAEDGYTFGRFATVPLGKGSEGLMALEATPGGYLAFTAEAFLVGPAGAPIRATFRLYKDARGKPGAAFAEGAAAQSFPAEGYAWVTARLAPNGKGVRLASHERFWLGVTSDDGKAYVAINPFSTSKRARWRKSPNDKLNETFNFKDTGVTPVSDYVARVGGFGYLEGGDRPEPLPSDDDALLVRLKDADRAADAGRHEDAITAYEEILAAMEKDPRRFEGWIPSVVNSIGVSAYELKRYDVALERFERSLRRAIAARDDAAAADVHENLGETSFFAGKMADAREHVERSRVLNARLSRSDRLVENEYWLGRASQELGQKDLAEEHLRAAQALAARAFPKDAKEEAEWKNRVALALAGTPEDAPGVRERTGALNEEGGKSKQKATYTDLLQFLSEDAARE